jgi:diguanylate cyclase (GGDEF)-like protein
MGYSASQDIDDWVLMLDAIYGGSQNYGKTPYEIHAHLTEVCGVFAKHLFKKKDPEEAALFLPKIFAWAVALFRKVHPQRHNLGEILLRKFPLCCPYCLHKPCSCWKGEKPNLQENVLRDTYFLRAASANRSLNGFQLMFREIYLDSWTGTAALSPVERMQRPFIRLVEELAEVGEALRFHHLYPDNFENELADVVAWWFALVSMIPTRTHENSGLAERVLWVAYPGQCPDCQMIPCLCRPGPVRQLMSRPAPGNAHRFDFLTSTFNQTAYNDDLERITSGELALPPPTACVRLDVDNFKSVNDKYGHAAGDEALRHIAAILRKTVRERDRVYRISGDEFGVLCADLTEEEAVGAMKRVCMALESRAVRWVSPDGTVSEFKVSVSIGVSELGDASQIKKAFKNADDASYASKHAGKGRVTGTSQLPSVQS